LQAPATDSILQERASGRIDAFFRSIRKHGMDDGHHQRGETGAGTTGVEADAATRTREQLRVVAAVSAGTASLLGLLVLVAGWGFDLALARSFAPGLVDMKPLTALGACVAGVSLLLVARQPAGARQSTLAGIAAGAMVLLGLTILAEHAFDLRLPFERLLFPAALARQALPHSGVPSPNSGLALLFVGAAVLGLVKKRPEVRWAQGLALATGFLAVQALIGYAYGAEPLYRIAGMNPMALPTAVVFLLLSVALLCLRPSRGLVGQVTADDAGGFVARRLLPAALLVPIAAGGLGLLAIQKGYVQLETGLAFVVVSAIFGMTGAVWASTRALSAADLRQRQANASARELSERFQRAVDQSPLPMMIHAEDGSILQVSRAWQDISGYGLDEIPTMTEWAQKAYGDSAQVACARAATLFDLEERLLEEGEYHVRTKSGDMRTWSLSSAPIGRVPDGRRIVISVGVDVTERARAERDLRISNERLAFLFNATSRLLASGDPQDLIDTLYVELSAMLELDMFLNFRIEEPDAFKPLRLTAYAGVTPAQVDRLRWLDYGEAVSGVVARERRRIVLDGVQTSADPMAAGLRALGIAAYVCHPLVARDEVVGTLSFGRRGGDEQRAREEAEDASRAKDQFMAVVSHELRTPLTAVVGYADLLDADVEGTLSAAHRRFVSRIRQSAWSLAAVIDEILTFARTRAGREEVRPELVDVAAMAKQAVAAMQPEAQKKRLRLVTRLPAAPVTTRTDPAKVRRILLNLLGNAVKFTEAGEIELALQPDIDRIRFVVRDTGPGIPAEYLESIFEPFVQVDASETRTQSGTGLGLTITRELAFLLGGTVSVESAVGAGSTFTVELPVEGE
jgi:PAS domain S-box-containing protein